MRVVPAAHLAWQVVDGQAILLDLARDVAIGLNSTGSFLVAHLLDGGGVEAAVAAAAAAYEVSEAQARSDLLSLLKELEARGLVEVSGGA